MCGIVKGVAIDALNDAVRSGILIKFFSGGIIVGINKVLSQSQISICDFFFKGEFCFIDIFINFRKRRRKFSVGHLRAKSPCELADFSFLMMPESFRGCLESKKRKLGFNKIFSIKES